MEKKIGSENHRGDRETMIVDRDTILGFSKDILINELNPTADDAASNMHGIYAAIRDYMRPINRFVKVTGRGTLYLEAYSSSERSQENWLLSEEEYVQAFERLLNQ